MKIVFICVNYNNIHFTKQFIESVQNISTQMKIVVVDNNSDENDIATLKKYNDLNIKVIFSEQNIGYFSGLNLGINSLGDHDYDYVIIGNNDLYFNKDFINKLQNRKINDDILVLAPNIIRLDGIHQNPHMVNKFGFVAKTYRRFYYSNYHVSVLLQKVYNSMKFLIKPVDRVGHNEESVITMGYGACYVLTKNFFKHFKELHAPNFLMEEEGVLANQVLSVKGKTLYTPELIVNHHDHSSIGKINSKKLYNFARESYKYHVKHLKYIN